MSNWFVFIALAILIMIIRLLCVTYLWTFFMLRFGQDFDLFLSVFAVPAFLSEIYIRFNGTYLINLVLGCAILKVLSRDGRKFLMFVGALIVVGFVGKILLVYLFD